MTRIACLIDTISRNAGGLNSSVRGLMGGIAKLGDPVKVFSVNDEYSDLDKGDWQAFDPHLSPAIGPRMFGYAPALEKALMEHDAQILHSHGLWTFTSFVSRNWAMQTRRPTIIHPHGMLDPWAVRHSRWKKMIALFGYERKNLEQASCIRALCPSELQSARLFGLQNPICTIPNGIDLPPEITDDSDALRPGKRIVLYLGRIHPKKGIDMLLKSWARLHDAKRVNDWTLVVAGWDQGGHESDLKRQATKDRLPWKDIRDSSPQANALQTALDNPPPLLFVGPAFERDKARLYRASEGFVLPSFSEGLPMVVLEAWSYRKPVVMTPMCNIPEGFEVGAAISADTTVESVEQGLARLIDLSDEKRGSMGTRGRDLVERKFTWPKVSEQMHAVNDWLVNGGPRPASVDT